MTPVLDRPRPVAPDVNRIIIALGPFSQAGRSRRSSRSARRRRSAAAGAASRPSRSSATCATLATHAQAARRRTSRALLDALRRDGRHRAPDGLHLLPGGRDQRLRPVRPLPARRPDRQHLLDVRDQPVAGCAANFADGRDGARSAHSTAAQARHDADARSRRATQGAGRGRRSCRRPRRSAARANAGRRRASATAARAAPRPAPRRAPPPTPPALATAGEPATRPLLDYLLGAADEPPRGAAIAANPVLIGAATTLVIIVAVFLAYNANNGPAVRADLHAHGRACPSAANLVRATRCASAACASAWSTRSRRSQHKDGTVDREARPEARDDGQAAAGRLDHHRPPALGARPEVRRDHQGHLDAGLRGRRARSRSSRRRPQPVEFDEFFNMFDQPTRTATQQNLRGFGDALRRPRRGPQPRDPGASTRCCATSRPVLHQPVATRDRLGRFFRGLERTARDRRAGRRGAGRAVRQPRHDVRARSPTSRGRSSRRRSREGPPR